MSVSSTEYWQTPFKVARRSLPKRDAEAVFGMALRVCAIRGYVMPQIDRLTMEQLARLVHELRLTDEAPKLLIIPGLEALPPLIPAPGPEPALSMPEGAVAILESFVDGEALVEAEESLMWAMEQRGLLSVVVDEFGNVWDITTEGREALAELRAARPE